MIVFRTRGLVFLCGWMVIVGLGCTEQGPAPVKVVSWNSATITEAAFQQYDSDHNGTLEASEFSPGIKAFAQTSDTDKNNVLTREEFQRRLGAHLELGTGLQSIAGVITSGGTPVPGVTVTLEPEAYMGGVIQEASGTTDNSGTFQLRSENQPLPGVQPGIYVIKLSGGNGSIPDKYKEKSEFGTEVGGDLPSILSLDIAN